jgi:hypothetical protein
MDLWAFASASSSWNPSFLWSLKFDPSDVRRFLLSDNCRSVAIYLSFSSMPLLGAILVRSAAVELGSGTLSHQNGARPS